MYIIKEKKNMKEAENNPATTSFVNFRRKYLRAFVYNSVVLPRSYMRQQLRPGFFT